MAPPQFLLPDDEDPSSFSENRDPNLSSSEVPESLLIEKELFPLNFHNHHHQKPEMFAVLPGNHQQRNPKHTKVIKGFGPVQFGPPEEKTQFDPVPFRGFPPASNGAYKLTSDGHDPKFVVNKSRPIVTMPSRRYLSTSAAVVPLEPKSRLLEVAESTSRRRASSNPYPYQLPTGISKPQDIHTEAEKIADTIDWNRSGWGAHDLGDAEGFYPAMEQRADFIKAIDDMAKSALQRTRHDYPHLLISSEDDLAITDIETVLQYCKKCRKNHIPPGSPITLPDRDTCGAFLPDWFPTQSYQKPWETFRLLYNKIVVYEEIERGFIHGGSRSGKPLWDKEYHDEHPKWRTIGRRQGWWKCRSGPDASEPERACQLCHKPKHAENIIAASPGTAPLVDRKKELTDWISEQMKNVGLNDKAVAEEMIRRMGAPQSLAYFPKYHVQPDELSGYETGNDSDPDGEKDKPKKPELKPTVLPNASMATLDLDCKIEKDVAATRNSSVSSSEGLVMRAIAGRGRLMK